MPGWCAQNGSRNGAVTDMRIVLFGQFGSGNAGNDASLEAMIALLARARPDAELVCVCPDPQSVADAFDIRAVASGRPGGKPPLGSVIDRLTMRMPSRLAGLAYPFAMMRGADMMIVPGTGFLDDFQERPLGWPLMILRWCVAARIAGARLAFVSIGAGPIRHRLSRLFMTSAARLCHYRSYRDAQSRDFLLGLGAAQRTDEIYPDLAFALAQPFAREPEEGRRIGVGVGVMAYSGWVRRHADGAAIYAAYLDKIEAFVRWLSAEGHEVRLITGDRQDREAVCEIVTRLKLRPPEGTRVRVRPTESLRQVMDEIALTDIVVATRFHNIVAALKLARPTVSLGYAEKNEALMRDVGLEGFSQHVEHFDIELLKSQFARALADRVSLSRRIAGMTGRYGARLTAQGQVLLRLLPPDEGAKVVRVRPAPAAR